MSRPDNWAAGELYEPYVGRWSRVVARDFLKWLSPAPAKDWLDVGCGTGALTQTIVESAAPRSVTGVDPSAGFVAYAEKHTNSPAASFRIGDAMQLPVDDSSVDIGVAGLVLNFVPEPPRAVAEMARVVRAEGLVAIYVWDYAGKMELMRYFWDATVALDPAARDVAEAHRFPMCAPQPLTDLFVHAGLRQVEVRSIDVPTRFRDFDDYWNPFLGGQGPAPAYAMSLSEERRRALRERIRLELPVAEDGSIDLIARAWAAKGRVA